MENIKKNITNMWDMVKMFHIYIYIIIVPERENGTDV